VELELHGLNRDYLLDLSFAQLWTRWRVLRGIETRQTAAAAQAALIGARAGKADVVKFFKRMGG